MDQRWKSSYQLSHFLDLKKLIFIRGCVKENVYATEVQDNDDLISNILLAAANIKGQPRKWAHVKGSMSL
jgi:hypothetical protein